MSFRKTLNRHYKIISLLQNKPRSFQEINDELANQQDATEDLRVSQRTFQRDIQEIEQNHQIEIASDKSRNVYYIKESAEDEYKTRLRENYDIINAIRMSKGMGESLFGYFGSICASDFGRLVPDISVQIVPLLVLS